MPRALESHAEIIGGTLHFTPPPVQRTAPAAPAVTKMSFRQPCRELEVKVTNAVHASTHISMRDNILKVSTMVLPALHRDNTRDGTMPSR